METGDESLCYRDEDGCLKLYSPGEEPFVWVQEKAKPEVHCDKSADDKRANDGTPEVTFESNVDNEKAECRTADNLHGHVNSLDEVESTKHVNRGLLEAKKDKHDENKISRRTSLHTEVNSSVYFKNNHNYFV